MHYLGLSVKGIRLRGGKLSGIQGPAPGFVGKRWFGPIIPFIIGILGNMGFPTNDLEVNKMHIFSRTTESNAISENDKVLNDVPVLG